MDDYFEAHEPALESAEPGPDANLLASLLRLGLGSAALGADIVSEPASFRVEVVSAAAGAQGASPALQPSVGAPFAARPASASRAVEGLVGMAVETPAAIKRQVARAWSLNRRVWRAAAPLRRPLEVLGATELARKPVEALTARVEPVVARAEEAGRAEVQRSRRFALDTISQVVDTVVAYLNQSAEVDALIRTQVDRLLPQLADHPAVQSLIRQQVDRILPELAENVAVERLISVQIDKILPGLADHPAVEELIKVQVDKLLPALAQSVVIQALIRAQAGQYLEFLDGQPDLLQKLIRNQGDAYIAYLNENPAAVQSLLQGQSASLAGNVMDEVREGTVTADSALEIIVRNLLGRKPRAELPPPPSQVQRRAEATRLPSDFATDDKGERNGR